MVARQKKEGEGVEANAFQIPPEKTQNGRPKSHLFYLAGNHAPQRALQAMHLLPVGVRVPGSNPLVANENHSPLHGPDVVSRVRGERVGVGGYSGVGGAASVRRVECQSARRREEWWWGRGRNVRSNISALPCVPVFHAHEAEPPSLSVSPMHTHFWSFPAASSS